jgi:hypothetical protein
MKLAIISELYKTYEPLFQPISKLQDEKIMKQVRRKLFEWIDAIPVYGFNSSGYDINVFRKYLPKRALDSNSERHVALISSSAAMANFDESFDAGSETIFVYEKSRC